MIGIEGKFEGICDHVIHKDTVNMKVIFKWFLNKHFSLKIGFKRSIRWKVSFSLYIPPEERKSYFKMATSEEDVLITSRITQRKCSASVTSVFDDYYFDSFSIRTIPYKTKKQREVSSVNFWFLITNGTLPIRDMFFDTTASAVVFQQVSGLLSFYNFV